MNQRQELPSKIIIFNNITDFLKIKISHKNRLLHKTTSQFFSNIIISVFQRE